LATNRQTFTVPLTTVTPQIHEALDIHCNFTAQITLDYVVLINSFANASDFVVS
jgi:hypothetical protein